jgi:hypothetical protein
VQVAFVHDLEEHVRGVRAVAEVAHLIDLCGAPHKSIYGEPAVMWSAVAPPQESSDFSLA